MSRPSVGAFVHAMKREMRAGNVSPQTDEHLRREFARLGWERSDALHADKVNEEIARLERQATTLRRLRNEMFPEQPPADAAA